MHRTFVDDLGRSWNVWETFPTSMERRASATEPDKLPHVGAAERRRRREARVAVPAHLQGGWLVFQAKHETRRLAPPPPGWADMRDRQLAELLERAIPQGKPRRLIE